jgi:hypothetical protein
LVADANLVQQRQRSWPALADGELLAKSIGSMTFSTTVRVGSSWKNWNTNPTFCPRQAARPDSDNRPRSAPAAWTVPDVGRSIPASRFSSVVLPLPDRPTMATNSPWAMSTLRWSTATTSPALNG